MESESVVCRRRAVVTRRLVPLPGGPSIVLRRPTRAIVGVDSCWRRRSMMVYSASHFLGAFTSNVSSTVAARSKLVQGVSCFCPEIFIRGDNHSAFFPGQPFRLAQLLDGFIACGWEKGSNIEALKLNFSHL